MAFDPDAYLAQKKTGFDPDAYLSNKGIAVPKEVPRASIEPYAPHGGARRFTEPLATVASGLASTAVGGIAGLATEGASAAKELFTGEPLETSGANVSQAVQEAGTFRPRTEEGKEGLQTLGDLAQIGIDAVNYPLSGVGGLIELVSGQGLDQAAATVKAIQESGVSKTLGERTFEETGSPLAASLAETVPTAVDILLGTRLPASVSASPAVEVAKLAATEVGKAAQDIGGIAKGVITKQSKTKRKIAELLTEGSRAPETAGFELIPRADDALNSRLIEEGLIPAPVPKSDFTAKLEGALNVGGPRIREVPSAKDALDVGYDPAMVSMITGMDDANSAKVTQMLDIVDEVRAKPELAVDLRPSNVVGDSVMDRIIPVFEHKAAANKELSAVLNKSGDDLLNFDDATFNFVDDLSEFGIAAVKDGKGDRKLDFSNTSLDTSDFKPLSEAFRQFQRLGFHKVGGTGKKLKSAHELKQILRRRVSFEGRQVPMSTQAQGILKEYAAGINKTIGESNTAYAAANKKFGDSEEALKAIDKTMGSFADVKGAAKALEDVESMAQLKSAIGTRLRTTLSNSGGRSGMVKSLRQLESTAKQYGSKFDDDIAQQILAVDEIERVFGGGKTSLQGVVKKATDDPLVDAKAVGTAVQTGGVSIPLEAGRRLFGKKKADIFAEQKMIDAMRKLLQETKIQTK